jgi:glycosyltransferase involved in cell wall biosynthesis
MRICQIMDGLPTAANGGAGVGAFHLVAHIPEPCLVLTRAAEAYPELPRHVRLVPLPARVSTTPPALRRRIFGAPGAGPLPTVRLQAAMGGRFLRHHAWSLVFALREMRRFGPDLLVCHQLQRLLYGVAGKHLLGGKLVVYIRGAAELEAVRRLPLLRILLRVPDRVVAVSPEMARRLRRLVRPDRIWLTSTALDTHTFHDWGRPRPPQIVTIANFKWMKGHGDLLAAFSTVRRRLPDHRLVVVGDGEERPRILAAIEQLGLADHVVLTGVLPRADVVRVLNESRLFVLASTFEGLPRALLEALACGTPAVVTDACNAEGIIDATGLSVPPRDPDALAGAMTTLLTDAALWQRCAARGPGVAAAYDDAVVAARDHRMYRVVVSGRASASPPREEPGTGWVSATDR